MAKRVEITLNEIQGMGLPPKLAIEILAERRGIDVTQTYEVHSYDLPEPHYVIVQ